MKNIITRLVCSAALLFIVSAGISAADTGKIKRTIDTYTAPDVVLVNQDGKKVRFRELLQTGKPVVVDFIFGTCTTICPILSVGYANLQQKIPQQPDKVHLVSISIDPENDTPKVLKEYLKRYRAKPGWDFYTGSRADINKVMRALDAWIPNKMSHYPLTLIWVPNDKSWVRLYGLMSSSEFLGECLKVGIK